VAKTFSKVKALRPLPKAMRIKEKYLMTTGNKTQEKENRLLSYEEQDIMCEVATKDPPFSQRAQALLAIDEGTTQAAAGQQAGLTKGQVRYWLTKFRKVRIAIFPEELLDQVQRDEGDEVDQQEMRGAEETVVPVEQTEAQQDDAPKAKKKAKKKDKKKSKKKAKKKSKKAKKPKKDKTTNKDKKTKKGKQPKKKKSKKKRRK
jgi:hypothetical protein